MICCLVDINWYNLYNNCIFLNIYKFYFVRYIIFWLKYFDVIMLLMNVYWVNVLLINFVDEILLSMYMWRNSNVLKRLRCFKIRCF